MKKIIFIPLLLLNYLISFSQKDAKEQFIANLVKNADCIFEGRVDANQTAFKDKVGNIYTIVKIKILKPNYNCPNSSEIFLVREGGEIGNRQEIVQDASPIADYNTFFLYSNRKVVDEATGKSYYIIENIAYDKNFDILMNERLPVKNFNELYSELSKKVSVTYEKKKLVESENIKINQVEEIPYEIKRKNFYEILDKKNEQLAKSLQANIQAKTLANDVTLHITNGIVSGNNFEFEVRIKGDNNSNYLDNIRVWLNYNTAVFNTSVVAANNVTITNYPNFSSNYYPGNNFMTDVNSNEFSFNISALVNNPIRTNITTSFQFLAHVRMKIINCGSNSMVNLTNASSAINAAYYAPSATSASIFQYSTLTYSGSANTMINCGPTIVDFTSPTRGGIDTLFIRGYNFEPVKGNGDVFFRNADVTQFPYITGLDAQDCSYWSDTLVKILVPSSNQNLSTTNGLNNTAGTGNFILYTNSTQTVAGIVNSNNMPFTVPYSILSVLNPTSGKKSKTHLVGNGAHSNYVVYCDSTIGLNAYKFGLIQRVIKDWECYTTANYELKYDASIVNTPTINYISFQTFGSTNALAITNLGIDRCSNGQNAISNFHIVFKKNEAWLFDSLGTQTLTTNTFDFYEIASHEFGHAMGIQHAIDPTSLMYWTPKFSTSTVTLPANRRRLLPNTNASVGGIYQVTSSIAAIAGAGCFNTFQYYQYSCSNPFVAILETKQNYLNVKAYPNPVSNGKVTLEYYVEDGKNSTIEIIDLYGKCLYKKAIDFKENEIIDVLDISDLSFGIYFLNVSSETNKTTFKLIKQ